MVQYKNGIRNTVLFFFVMVSSYWTAISKHVPEEIVMHAHLSLAWYPNKAVLLDTLCNELDNKAARFYSAHLDPHQIRALVVPHAGYEYSGTVAAAAYRTVSSAHTISRIIILAPSHYKEFVGVRLPAFEKYVVPNGVVSIDTAVVKKLAAQRLFAVDDTLFTVEHSVEIQLPLLQHYLKHVSVVPLIVGNVTEKQARLVAKTLASFVDKQTLIIVSTDFTHYGNQFKYTPFIDHISERIRKLDAALITAVQQQRIRPFLTLINDTQATVCGRMPLVVFLALCEQQELHSVESRLIAYGTSSDATVTGNSVSYAGLVFTTQKRVQQPIEYQFTSMEQQILLDLSKRSLRALFDSSQKQFLLPILGNAGIEKRGVFVTLYKQGALRGCIGIVEPDFPLIEGIMTKTESAALHDTRFAPVTAAELPDITITLSILSIPYKIPSYKHIILEKQGIILKQGIRQALFLPKVASEFGWDLTTTLTELSVKAGLPNVAWKDAKTEFFVFTALDTLVEPVMKGDMYALGSN